MDLAKVKREMSFWLLRGAAAGLIVLGIGGRGLMRVIAHMEHRPQFVFSLGGTLRVILVGTVVGLLLGLIYAVLRILFRQPVVRTVLFMVAVELVVWIGVSELLLIPQLMFMGLAVVFVAAVIALGRPAPAPV
jgi:hypothetical protein